MSRLTPRELEVARLLAQQKGIREIAFSLKITPETARKHRDNAVRKVGSQVALVLEVDRAARI